VAIQSQLRGALTFSICDFALHCRRVKKQLCQVIRVQPVHIVWKYFNFRLIVIATLSYSKFEIIQLPREESAPKSTVIRNMGVGKIFTGGGH